VRPRFIRFEDVTKDYVTSSGVIHALRGLTFDIDEGEFVVIAGPSGAGKTTLLNMLGGMDSPTGGTVMMGDAVVSAFDERRLTLFRRSDVGFVFQFYSLMPNLTALENIELAVEICHDAIPPRDVLASVGLAERAGSYPSELSGGEQQRVAIARAVAKNPKIVLCDEPTGALDYETGKSILRLLRDLCRDHEKTVVVVTHNSAIKEMADRVIFVKNGVCTGVHLNEHPTPIEEIEW